MLAVIRTVDLSEEVLRDHQVLVSTDNTTVVSYINYQGGTHSAIELFSPYTPGFYSSIFVIPKEN
jgi:hypothetical protein